MSVAIFAEVFLMAEYEVELEADVQVAFYQALVVGKYSSGSSDPFSAGAASPVKEISIP